MSRLHRDIAALADGSYERPGLRERIASSPELTLLLEEQRRAVAATRAARPAAPPELRAALAGPGPRRAAPLAGRPALGPVLATAGVIALAVVALLPSGPTPSVAAVAALSARGPTAPAPAVDPTHQDALRSQLAGVRYPYWQGAFGLRTSGARTDRLDGRPTMTVYYASAARATVGYTIVGGSPLPEPSGATARVEDGTRFLGLIRSGRTIVTWRRGGHTCVISATAVPLPTLLRLAEWHYATSAT